MSRALAESFARLHQGGAVADGIEFRPRKDANDKPTGYFGEAYLVSVEEHLFADEPLGVYPLIPGEPPTVNFGVVDWDAPRDPEPLIQAANVTKVFDAFNVVAFTELSRSKGVHLWIYAAEPIEAKLMRDAMMAACLLVEAPVKEVYPKQISLTNKNFGNGIRLPYPAVSNPGRQVMRLNSWTLTLEEFCKYAEQNLVTREQLERIAAHLPKPQAPPSPMPLRRRRSDADKYPPDLQDQINNGPTGTDRSDSLFTLACRLMQCGESKERSVALLSEWDDRWVRKFSDRQDKTQRYEEMCDSAVAAVSVNQQSFKESK
tara:strand:+ start:2747 stop:3697 length:951 start_codon:yes stop_codon:yes gene_type:complete